MGKEGTLGVGEGGVEGGGGGRGLQVEDGDVSVVGEEVEGRGEAEAGGAAGDEEGAGVDFHGGRVYDES